MIKYLFEIEQRLLHLKLGYDSIYSFLRKELKYTDSEAYIRVNAMNLRNPRLIGFGIKDNATFTKASQYAAGAIIGSQFIRILQDSTENTLHNNIVDYVKFVKG